MASFAPLYDVIRGGNNSRPFRRAMRARERRSKAGAAGPGWEKLVDQAGDAKSATPLPFPQSTRTECYCANFVWKATGRKARPAPPTFRRWHKTPMLRQVFSHLPAVEPLTTKDRLLRVMDAYARSSGRTLEQLGVPDTFLVEPRSGKAPKEWRGWADFLASHAKHAAVPGARNLWLVKPASANRGIGIQVIDGVEAAKDILTGVAGRASMGVKGTWVVQKYIENPLLVAGRKFDLRVWALATDEGDVFIHGPGYVRTSSEAFDMSTTDRRVHLTNYCLQVKHRGEGSSFERFEPGNTLSWSQLAAYLGQVAMGRRCHTAAATPPADAHADPDGAVHPSAAPDGPPCVAADGAPAQPERLDSQWPPVADAESWAAGCEAMWGAGGLWPKVTSLMAETVRALRGSKPTAGSHHGCKEYGFGDRPNASSRHRFELLGYDFMVTSDALDPAAARPLAPPAEGCTAADAAARLDMGVRLIEVNSNPSLSYQCGWHRRLVDGMCEGVVRRTIDVVMGGVAPPEGAEDADAAGDDEGLSSEDEASDAEEEDAAPAPAASRVARPARPQRHGSGEGDDSGRVSPRPTELRAAGAAGSVGAAPAAASARLASGDYAAPRGPPRGGRFPTDGSGAAVLEAYPSDPLGRRAALCSGWVPLINVHKFTPLAPPPAAPKAAPPAPAGGLRSPKAASSRGPRRRPTSRASSSAASASTASEGTNVSSTTSRQGPAKVAPGSTSRSSAAGANAARSRPPASRRPPPVACAAPAPASRHGPVSARSSTSGGGSDGRSGSRAGQGRQSGSTSLSDARMAARSEAAAGAPAAAGRPKRRLPPHPGQLRGGRAGRRSRSVGRPRLDCSAEASPRSRVAVNALVSPPRRAGAVGSLKPLRMPVASPHLSPRAVNAARQARGGGLPRRAIRQSAATAPALPTAWDTPSAHVVH